MSDSLHDSFGQVGQKPTGPTYAHPQQDEIIRDAVALLIEIPEGKRLQALVKEFDLTIRVIIGKEPGFFIPDKHSVVLISPKNIVGVNPYETACNLGLAIKEIEINMINIQRLNEDRHLLFQKMIDIVLEMCKIVAEFEDVKKHTKLVDLVEKLGHGNVYRLYRSKADYKELADLIVKNLKL